MVKEAPSIQNLPYRVLFSGSSQNHYSEISELCRKNPVAITVNGREDVVVMSHENYARMQDHISELESRLSVYQHLAQSQDDIRLGRVQDVDQAFDDLLKELDQTDVS